MSSISHDQEHDKEQIILALQLSSRIASKNIVFHFSLSNGENKVM